MTHEEKDILLMRIIRDLQAQIGGLETVVQDIIKSTQGESFNMQKYHQHLIACREAYRTHAGLQLEDIDPAAAAKLFADIPPVIPPEDEQNPK